MRLRIHAVSDRGLERERNEDAFLVVDLVEPSRGKGGRTELDLEIDGRPALVAVADGMGGVAAGELASQLALGALSGRAVEAARNGGPPADPDDRMEWLVTAVADANRRILARGREDRSTRGMGTTLTVGLVEDGACIVAHVGDTRAYHLRAGRLTRLTVDHSVVQGQVASGKLTPEEAESHPRRNQLLEALGVHKSPRIDRLRAVLEPGDRLLLCSDGVHDLVKDPELAAILGGGDSPADQGSTLVTRARERGGFDNITAVVVHIASARSTELGGTA